MVTGGFPEQMQSTLAAHPQSFPVTRDRATGNTDVDTAVTSGRAAQIALQGAKHPLIQAAAAQALGTLPDDATRKQKYSAIWQWVRDRVEYTHDEDNPIWQHIRAQVGNPDLQDFLQVPWLLLQSTPPRGDCDDMAMLAGAMCGAVKLPYDFITLAADPTQPNTWSHIYGAGKLEDGSKFPIDCIPPSEGPGWEAPRWFRKQIWPIFWDFVVFDLGVNLAVKAFEVGLGGPRNTLHGFGRLPIEEQALYGRRGPKHPARRRGLADGDTISVPTFGSGPDFPLPSVDVNSTINVPTFGGGAVPVAAPGFNFGSIIPGLVQTGQTILKAQFAQPPAGTYIQTGPNGQSIFYRAPAGGGIALPGGISFGGSGSAIPSWAWAVGGVVILAMLFKAKG